MLQKLSLEKYKYQYIPGNVIARLSFSYKLTYFVVTGKIE